MGTQLQWVTLPSTGRIYAHTALLLGAPLTMEQDVPFVLGLVDLDPLGPTQAPVRLLARFEGGSYEDFKIGQRLRMKVHHHDDERVTYRFEPAQDEFLPQSG